MIHTKSRTQIVHWLHCSHKQYVNRPEFAWRRILIRSTHKYSIEINTLSVLHSGLWWIINTDKDGNWPIWFFKINRKYQEKMEFVQLNYWINLISLMLLVFWEWVKQYKNDYLISSNWLMKHKIGFPGEETYILWMKDRMQKNLM